MAQASGLNVKEIVTCTLHIERLHIAINACSSVRLSIGGRRDVCQIGGKLINRD